MGWSLTETEVLFYLEFNQYHVYRYKKFNVKYVSRNLYTTYQYAINFTIVDGWNYLLGKL